MFKNYYTTCMSADAKKIQMRFLKMRSNVGKRAKIMSVVMTAAIIITMLFATVVMAAVGSDGLEHWEQNEVYFLNGVKTTVSVENQDVPQWVSEDISDNGNIDIFFKRYEVRDTNGWLQPMDIIEMNGNKGSVVLGSQGYNAVKYSQDYIDNNPQNILVGLVGADTRMINYRFIEFNNVGCEWVWNSAYSKFISPLSGKFRGVNLCFAVSDDWKTKKTFIRFSVNDKNDNPRSTFDDEFAYMTVPQSKISFVGDFENDIKNIYIITTDYTFSSFEKNYQNKKVDGTDISVASAKEDEITVDIKSTLPEITRIDINVCNEFGYPVNVNINNGDSAKIGNNVLSVDQELSDGEYWEQESKEGKFLPGHKYRVIVGLINKDNSVVYRWQDYVTIQ